MSEAPSGTTWEYYETIRGEQVVVKELRKLRLDARGAVKWQRRLLAIADGTAIAGKDFKPLRGHPHLFEALMKYNGDEYRLLYGQVSGRRVLVAVRAFMKKTDKTPPVHIDVAEKRLSDWKARQESP